MFAWDGSEVTNFILLDEVIIQEGIYKKNKYWIFNYRDKFQICLLKEITKTLPCLIDELKPAFNLEKVGTHWFRLNGKKFMIKRLITQENMVIQELSLDKLKYNKYIQSEVQKIFLFRELLGVRANFEKNIVLRNKGLYVNPISFNETEMEPHDNKKIIPETIINRWFKEETLNEVLVKIFETDNINLVLLKLKSNLDEICLRVDKESISAVDGILTRIRSRLNFMIDE